MNEFLRRFIPLAVVATFLSVLVSVSVHAVLRAEANDPQIQISEDSARFFAGGGTPPENTDYDLDTTLAPFVMVYDAQGAVVAASGKIDGAVPVPPAGVFTFTKEHGQDRFTWEPKKGARFAAVVTSVPGENPRFVLAGRSLREVEKREALLREIVAVGWVVTLLASALSCFLLRRKSPTPTVV